MQGSGATSYMSNEEDIYSIAYKVPLNDLTLLCCVQNVGIISHSIVLSANKKVNREGSSV